MPRRRLAAAIAAVAVFVLVPAAARAATYEVYVGIDKTPGQPKQATANEFFPHNVLLRNGTVHPVDWEAAAIAPGELDLATVGQLDTAIADAERDGADTVVLDLRELDFMDSTGIGALLRAQQRLRAAGRHLVLVKSPNTPIAQILAVSGADADIEVVSAG